MCHNIQFILTFFLNNFSKPNCPSHSLILYDLSSCFRECARTIAQHVEGKSLSRYVNVSQVLSFVLGGVPCGFYEACSYVLRVKAMLTRSFSIHSILRWPRVSSIANHDVKCAIADCPLQYLYHPCTMIFLLTRVAAYKKHH